MEDRLCVECDVHRSTEDRWYRSGKKVFSLNIQMQMYWSMQLWMHLGSTGRISENMDTDPGEKEFPVFCCWDLIDSHCHIGSHLWNMRCHLWFLCNVDRCIYISDLIMVLSQSFVTCSSNRILEIPLCRVCIRVSSISPSAAAPRSASITAWISTSASECPRETFFPVYLYTTQDQISVFGQSVYIISHSNTHNHSPLYPASCWFSISLTVSLYKEQVWGLAKQPLHRVDIINGFAHPAFSSKWNIVCSLGSSSIISSIPFRHFFRCWGET